MAKGAEEMDAIGSATAGGHQSQRVDATAESEPSAEGATTAEVPNFAPAPRRTLYGTGDGEVDPADCWNAEMQEFYAAQGLVHQHELEVLFGCMRSSLPAAIRLPATLRASSQRALQLLRDEQGWQPIPWYPGGLAWRCQSDTFHSQSNSTFREALREGNAAGSLTFQEEVSMLPPLLLGLEGTSTVLDMCAAPGSKSLQILDLMEQQKPSPVQVAEGCAAPEETRQPAPATTTASGVLVANEADPRRANNILVPRLRAAHSPVVIVTVGNGARYPLLSPPGDASGTSVTLFDRILVDAPCSGDGTIRKDPSVWRTWRLKNAVELHSLQLRLLCRGLSMLRVGGRLVYSTCSLNPLENEAVVAAALVKFGPRTVRLIPCGPLIPRSLTTRPGLQRWFVADPSGGSPLLWLDGSQPSTWPVPRSYGSRQPLKKTMFPEASPAEVLSQMAGCVRLLPHDNDTGGFFCAVLTKIATTADDWAHPDGNGPGPSQGQGHSFADGFPEPERVEGETFHSSQVYRGLEERDPLTRHLSSFFGLRGSGVAMVAVAGRRVVTLSTGAYLWLRALEAARGGMKFKQLRIASMGARLFKMLPPGFAANSVCRWRPCQEGTELLSQAELLSAPCNQMMTKQRLTLPRDLMLCLLEQQLLRLEDLPVIGGLKVGGAGGQFQTPLGLVEVDPGLQCGGVLVRLAPSLSSPEAVGLCVAAFLGERALIPFVTNNDAVGMIQTLTSPPWGGMKT